jgi:soluble lytic murein transglycosylase-like protein
MKKLVVIFILSLSLQANSKIDLNKYDEHFKYYGQKYNISYVLLKMVALTENEKFDKNAIRYNKNGTKDIGLMQINTLWIKELSSFHLNEKKLKDINTNIEIAAYILSNLIKKYGYSWETIGMYHSRTKKYKRRWLKRAKKKILQIAKNDKRINVGKK